MRTAFPRPAARIPVCSQAGLCLAVFPSGGAERSEKAEGKIKETGTTLGRFLKLLLSAHWLGEPHAAPLIWTPRAAIRRKTLALQGFDRHYRRKTPDFCSFPPKARP